MGQRSIVGSAVLGVAAIAVACLSVTPAFAQHQQNPLQPIIDVLAVIQQQKAEEAARARAEAEGTDYEPPPPPPQPQWPATLPPPLFPVIKYPPRPSPQAAPTATPAPKPKMHSNGEQLIAQEQNACRQRARALPGPQALAALRQCNRQAAQGLRSNDQRFGYRPPTPTPGPSPAPVPTPYTMVVPPTPSPGYAPAPGYAPLPQSGMQSGTSGYETLPVDENRQPCAYIEPIKRHEDILYFEVRNRCGRTVTAKWAFVDKYFRGVTTSSWDILPGDHRTTWCSRASGCDGRYILRSEWKR